ncbi:helix-turn-helix domain-containing protein [Flavobacterium suncheonense]|uniref:helix-turn-helix domain-containing protein n=1 Tax=Flavobacterium suncheonense TaxID=350894 RepID=UPI000686045C|nr:helix-turn-helix transcriptional regulator [Flavobacterium suncheonense]
MKTGIKIKRLRENRRLSQEELACLIGVSQVTIGKWEQGTGIKHEYIKKLATSLNVSVEYLLLEEKQQDSGMVAVTNNEKHIEITIKASGELIESFFAQIDRLIVEKNNKHQK